MSYARRIGFGMAISAATVATIYATGKLIEYAMAHTGDTYFVVMHWHPWGIACIALLSFALGFSRTPKTS